VHVEFQLVQISDKITSLRLFGPRATPHKSLLLKLIASWFAACDEFDVGKDLPRIPSRGDA